MEGGSALDVDGDDVGAGSNSRPDLRERVVNHQMNVGEQRRIDGPDKRWTDGKRWAKNAVHDVDMDHARPGTFEEGDLVVEAAKVRCQNSDRCDGSRYFAK